MASLVPGLFAPSPTSWYTKRVERLSCTVVGTNTEGSAMFKAQGATPKDGYGRRCECLDLYKELVPYEEARSWQKYIVQRRHTLVEREIDHSDILILLQHPPLYTLGTGSSEEYLNFNIKDPPYDVYRSERGGEVTYHGPGQLVMYPIINLRYHKMDLHWYLRSLEEVVIQVLSKTFSLKASRLEGLTGVWIGNQKVAAIGVRVSRWITFHGLALNVTTDLKPFEHIVPCGIRNKQVGSIAELLGISSGGITAEDASQLMDIAHESLLKEFSEVFQVALQLKPNLSNANGSDLSVDNSTRIVSESIGIRLSS